MTSIARHADAIAKEGELDYWPVPGKAAERLEIMSADLERATAAANQIQAVVNTFVAGLFLGGGGDPERIIGYDRQRRAIVLRPTVVDDSGATPRG